MYKPNISKSTSSQVRKYVRQPMTRLRMHIRYVSPSAIWWHSLLTLQVLGIHEFPVCSMTPTGSATSGDLVGPCAVPECSRGFPWVQWTSTCISSTKPRGSWFRVLTFSPKRPTARPADGARRSGLRGRLPQDVGRACDPGFFNWPGVASKATKTHALWENENC